MLGIQKLIESNNQNLLEKKIFMEIFCENERRPGISEMTKNFFFKVNRLIYKSQKDRLFVGF